MFSTPIALFSFRVALVQVKNLKTLAEALEKFTAEEVVNFKWDKEINTGTGRTLTQGVLFLLFCRPGVYPNAGFWLALLSEE